MPVSGQVFDVLPSIRRPPTVRTAPADADLSKVDAVAIAVTSDGDVPAELRYDREALRRCGFSAKLGQALAVPISEGPAMVATGLGPDGDLDGAALRRAAAAFARAVPDDGYLAARVPARTAVSAGDAAAAMVEGVLLARYRFDMRTKPRGPVQVTELVLLAPPGAEDEVRAGADRGLAVAAAAVLSRDLANCPAADLTAVRMAEVAVEVGARSGLQVETFDRDALVALGCGGLLGVNKGSVQPPRMIRLRYRPDGEPTGRLTLVGKGVMYDSGGINLKPSDASHSTMKNDMSGAGAVLAAMSALRALGCRAAVTGYLMCTDNMPSGSALKLGDVLTMRNGKTVEVQNTDAEGRLILADGLSLAAEAEPDVIVDIATLTGSAMAALGTEYAAVIGSSQPVIDALLASSASADEPLWQMPLARDKYRKNLDSVVADMRNVGGPYAGATTASIFLSEFVGDVPWAHLDIAGPMNADGDSGWTSKGATGFGTRILIDFACTYEAS
jgi:leucyl aminopeptidase